MFLRRAGGSKALWQIGPMARRVEDLGSMLSLLAAPDAQDHTVIGMPFGDPAEVRMKDLRIAFFTDNGIVPAEAETIAVVRTGGCCARA